jgi:putative SOS response-associated peptidase YedK
MCGRYSITLPPEAIREIFQTHGELPNWPAYYNAAPTTALPVARQANEDVLVSRPVSKAVGNVKNNAPELLLTVS